MRKTKIVYFDGSRERELVIPPELLFDSEKKEKFIKDHIGNVDYVERRYYDEADEDIDVLPEHDADNSKLINNNSENVSELPPSITEAPDSSVIDSEQPSIETLTAEIKMYLHIANQSIIEVGKRLIQAKEMLPHGEWANWLKKNFNLTQQSANRFMRVAERFGKLNIDVQFGATQMIAMLDLPEGEEQNFLALKSAEGTPAEQMTIKQLRSEIKKFKDESELNRKKAGDLEDKLAVAESKLSANYDYVEHLKSITDSLMTQNSNLKTKLEQRPTVTPPDYDDLKREVQELRERPVEVATEFPADYESAKQKLAQLETDADNFKRDTALKLSLQQFLKTIPELIAADNLQSVVNSCANDNLQDFESQLKQLDLFCSLLHQHLNTLKDDPVYKLPINRDAIISEIKHKMAQDSSGSTSKKFFDLISSDGYENLIDIPDDYLLDLLKKIRNF